MLEGLRVRSDGTYLISLNLMSYVSRSCARCRSPYLFASSVSVALGMRRTWDLGYIFLNVG